MQRGQSSYPRRAVSDCILCWNHGVTVPFNYKHRRVCPHFGCRCARCSKAGRELKSERQRGVQSDSRRRLKTDSDVPYCVYCSAHGLRIYANGQHSKFCKYQSCRCPSCSKARKEDIKPCCVYCGFHGRRVYDVGQHAKFCGFRTCQCQLCKGERDKIGACSSVGGDTRLKGSIDATATASQAGGSVSSSASDRAEESRKRGRSSSPSEERQGRIPEIHEDPDQEGYRVVQTNTAITKSLPNCSFCSNHGFKFALKEHHYEYCLFRKCPCEGCRGERKRAKDAKEEKPKPSNNEAPLLKSECSQRDSAVRRASDAKKPCAVVAPAIRKAACEPSNSPQVLANTSEKDVKSAIQDVNPETKESVSIDSISTQDQKRTTSLGDTDTVDQPAVENQSQTEENSHRQPILIGTIETSDSVPAVEGIHSIDIETIPDAENVSCVESLLEKTCVFRSETNDAADSAVFSSDIKSTDMPLADNIDKNNSDSEAEGGVESDTNKSGSVQVLTDTEVALFHDTSGTDEVMRQQLDSIAGAENSNPEQTDAAVKFVTSSLLSKDISQNEDISKQESDTSVEDMFASSITPNINSVLDITDNRPSVSDAVAKDVCDSNNSESFQDLNDATVTVSPDTTRAADVSKHQLDSAGAEDNSTSEQSYDAATNVANSSSSEDTPQNDDIGKNESNAIAEETFVRSIASTSNSDDNSELDSTGNKQTDLDSVGKAGCDSNKLESVRDLKDTDATNIISPDTSKSTEISGSQLNSAEAKGGTQCVSNTGQSDAVEHVEGHSISNDTSQKETSEHSDAAAKDASDCPESKDSSQHEDIDNNKSDEENFTRTITPSTNISALDDFSNKQSDCAAAIEDSLNADATASQDDSETRDIDRNLFDIALAAPKEVPSPKEVPDIHSNSTNRKPSIPDICHDLVLDLARFGENWQKAIPSKGSAATPHQPSGKSTADVCVPTVSIVNEKDEITKSLLPDCGEQTSSRSPSELLKGTVNEDHAVVVPVSEKALGSVEGNAQQCDGHSPDIIFEEIKCKTCGMTWQNSHQLRLHGYLIHGIDCESIPGKVYRCSVCSVENASQAAIFDHESTAHMGLVPLNKLFYLLSEICNVKRS